MILKEANLEKLISFCSTLHWLQVGHQQGYVELANLEATHSSLSLDHALISFDFLAQVVLEELMASKNKFSRLLPV